MIRSNLLSRLEDGYLNLDTDDIIEELLKGNTVNNVHMTDNAELEKYYESCRKYDVEPFNLKVKKVDHSELIQQWRIPKEYLDIDPVEYIIKRCKNDIEFKRAGDELVEFSKRNQLILINLMIYIVDIMRKNNIVWGVGRGSSVASFCLYVIGINKINPLQYDIDYREFFK